MKAIVVCVKAVVGVGVIVPMLAFAEGSDGVDSRSTVVETPSMVSDTAVDAKDALAKNEADATQQKAIEEVFTSNKTYSMQKKGSYSATLDTDYSFYRNSRYDIATAQGSSTITLFDVTDDAQHTLTNTLSVQYGLRDNVSVGVNLPVVAKTDVAVATNVAGLGDFGVNVRWEPFELERKRMPISVSGSISLPTGQSPFEIASEESLSTGKGYYSFGGGLSTRKYFDPVVLFASSSIGYGTAATVDQNRGVDGRHLVEFQPGLNFGFGMGYAYSLNYDVSITMSYSQGFSVGNAFTYSDGSVVKSRLNSSGSLTSSLGVRVTPKTLVNASLSIGMSEDSPDVSLGVSLPLDFLGFGKQVK